MKVYAWLIDLIHRRKNCPTGIIPEWPEGQYSIRLVSDGNEVSQITADFRVDVWKGHYSYTKVMTVELYVSTGVNRCQQVSTQFAWVMFEIERNGSRTVLKWKKISERVFLIEDSILKLSSWM